MAQQNKIGKHCTAVVNNDKLARVTYHSTDVVLWDKVAGTVTLDTGGYFTATTKVKMNQALSQWGLSTRVFQIRGLWYAHTVAWHDVPAKRIPFIGESLKLQGGAL